MSGDEWEIFKRIGELSGPPLMALMIIGFIRGWIWPGFAVKDIIRQRDYFMNQNQKLVQHFGQIPSLLKKRLEDP